MNKTKLNKKTHLNKITECQIFITRRCNLNCGYCNLVKKKTKNELTMDEWKRAFKILDKIDIKTVKILGGEPTVLEGFEDLLRFINRETSIKYAVLSNSIFTSKKTDDLINAGMQGYFASIDGIDAVKSIDDNGIAKSHAGYEKLMIFKKKGIKILGANVVITKKNILEIPEIVRILSDNGIWVNLCPVIHGTEDFWEFRSAVSNEFRFSDADVQKINNIMIKLLQMKHEGYKIAVPDSYLINLSKYAIDNNWKCSELIQLRVDADGGLMLCNDIRGDIAEKYNILDLNKEKFEEFKKIWKEERKKFNCSGCYWSCFLVAENNLKNNRLEFDYMSD